MAKLEVQVGINNAAFKAGLDQMRSGAAKLKGDLSGMFAGAVGFGSLIAGMKSVISYADQLSDMSQRFGASTTTLQKFKMVLDENGSSLESFAGALNKLEVAQSKALQGDEKLIEAFASLGVTVQDLQSLSTEDLILKIGGSSMEAAQMVQVLGKSSLELRLALRAASEGGLEFGNIMSDHVVNSLATANDAINRFTTQAKAAFGSVMVSVGDWMTDQGASVAGGAHKLAELIRSIVSASGRVLTGDFRGAKDALDEYSIKAKQISQDIAAARAANDPVQKGSSKQGGGNLAFDDAEANAKAAQKREDRLQKIRDAEADAARAALEGQEKINALMEERNRLLEVYKAAADDDDAGLDALEKAQQIQRQIEQEEKRQTEEKKREEKKIADDKAKAAKEEADEKERIASARADEARIREDDKLSQLSGEDKISALQAKRNIMSDEAARLELTDPEEAARRRGEIVGVDAQIRGEQQSLEEKRKAALEGATEPQKKEFASVAVSSLQAVGGGGGRIGGTSDPILRANEQQVNLLREIKAELSNANQRGSRKESDPWR